MTGPLQQMGHDLEEMIDAVSDWSVDLLRRTHGDLLIMAAQRDIEGATDWRDLSKATRFTNE